MHKETGPGQYEIVLKYDDVMKSVDNYILTKETIYHHFKAIGKRAVFLPKTCSDLGNGCHVHLSLWKDGFNIMGE